MKVTAETELSHQTVFSFKKFSSPKEVNITANTAAIAFFFSLSPHTFYFSFPCSFLGGFSGSLGFWSFSCHKTAIFVRYVFKYPAR